MARYENMMPPGCVEDDESEEEVGVSGATAHKAKPRRKSHQRPQGSDQVRQAFSKRKKGLVLKAYQLNALTDAKVFMFIVNDKGTSWAYATPGFNSSLNPELLKELRALAQVPDQAKLVTEVMSDPPVTKSSADTVGSSEQTSARRADQVPAYAAPCTRTATGSLPSRSRSSYSGGSAGEAQGPDTAPLARAGSTTTTRMHSAVQSDEHSPSKPRPRPPSGQSMACGRPNSAAGQSHFFAPQRPGGKVGTSIEPPTPCGVYNLLGQPISAAVDSPTVNSEVAASSASPSSRQHTVLPEFAAGSRMAAAVPAAGQPYEENPMQGVEPQEQHQQQSCWQCQVGVQWLAQQRQQQLQQQHQHQQEHQRPPAQVDAWTYYQQQYGTVQEKAADAWAAVELKPVPTSATNSQNAAGGCKPLLQQQQAQLHSCSSDPSGMAHAAAQIGVTTSNEAWQQQQQQQTYSVSAAAAAEGSGQAGFDNMQRGLPPLRVGRPYVHSDPDGAHSAPAAGYNSLLGHQGQWIGFDCKVENLHLQAANDAGMFGASSSGYSSYQHSPSFAQQEQQQQQHATFGSVAEAQDRRTAPHGGITSAAAAAMMGQHDPHSASHSPTAALSQQMVSSLVVESPAHSPMHNPTMLTQQQQYSHWQVQAPYQQQQLQQTKQQAHQGSCIPRTDDLVTDPLMDILMDQALGGNGSTTVPALQQHQQWGQSPHVSIMDATLQHGIAPPGHLQQQLYSQHSQQAEQQQYGQHQPGISHMQQPVAAGAALHSSASMPPPAAPGQQRYSGNYLRMMDMLKHMPLVSDPNRKTWEEHMRQLKSTLAQHESQEFSAYVRALWQSKESAAAAVSSTAAAGPGGYVPRYAGACQGGKRLGPSRLSATVSHSMDDAAAAAVDAAVGEATGMLRTSSMPNSHGVLGCTGAATGLGSAPSISSAMASTPSTAVTMSSGLQSYPSQTLAAPINTAQAAPQLQQQMSHLGGGVTTGASHLVSTEGPGRTPSAPMPSAPGVLGDLLTARSAHCSSPLKRSQSSMGGPGAAVASRLEVAEAMSPLKRACTGLPDPPGFGGHLHSEFAEDDAVAWAAVEHFGFGAGGALCNSSLTAGAAPHEQGAALQEADRQAVCAGPAPSPRLAAGDAGTSAVDAPSKAVELAGMECLPVPLGGSSAAGAAGMSNQVSDCMS